jgi:hypothetical protein
MRKSGNSHTIDVVFVLALACAFAASILMVLMLGVNVYGNIQKTSDAQFNERTCLSYVTAKIHSNDNMGDVRTGEFGGVPALFLDQQIDEEYYTTVIYAYDGWLRELFTDRNSTMTSEESWLTPDAGMPLIEVDNLSFDTVKPGLITVEYLDKNGDGGKMFVHLRSEGGENI